MVNIYPFKALDLNNVIKLIILAAKSTDKWVLYKAEYELWIQA